MSRKNSPKTSVVPNFNFAILGMNGAGKSATVVKYLTRRFIVEYSPFIHDRYTKLESINGQDYVINIQDTYDREELELKELYRWANILIVIYSITSRSTFHRAKEILESLENFKEHTLILVGNKIDLEQYRFVTKEEGEMAANHFNCLFFESSAAQDFETVERIFTQGVLQYLSRSTHPPLPQASSLLPLSPLIDNVFPATSLSLANGNGTANNANTVLKKLSNSSSSAASTGSLGRNRSSAKSSVSSMNPSTPAVIVDNANKTNQNSGSDFEVSNAKSSSPGPSVLNNLNVQTTIPQSPAKKNSSGFRFFKKSKF